MSCNKAQRLLSDYIDGRFSDNSSAAEYIESHLKVCGKCLNYKLLNEKIANGIRTLPKENPSPEYWADFYPRLQRRLYQGMPKRNIFKPFIQYAGIAAMWLLAVCLILILDSTRKKDTAIPASQYTGSTIREEAAIEDTRRISELMRMLRDGGRGSLAEVKNGPFMLDPSQSHIIPVNEDNIEEPRIYIDKETAGGIKTKDIFAKDMEELREQHPEYAKFIREIKDIEK